MFCLAAALLWAGIVTPGEHQRGVEYYKQQKYLEAIAALETAVQSEQPKTPEYRESVLLIGQSYFMLSQAPKAIPWLEKAPDSNEANYMLGYAYLQTKQPAQSETAFARLFGIASDTANGHLLAAQMMMKQEYEPEAQAEAQKAIALDARLPEAHFVLAEIAIFRGRFDDAISSLNAELAVNPSYSMAWYRLGDAYSRQEHWEQAIPNLQRAVWLNPDFSGPFILLGKCYFKTGNYSNAEGILKRAILLDPRNQSANYLLGQTLEVEGKKPEAQAVFETLKALKRAPAGDTSPVSPN
jgi:tetratricopeptide (TPR) repeat protein